MPKFFLLSKIAVVALRRPPDLYYKYPDYDCVDYFMTEAVKTTNWMTDYVVQEWKMVTARKYCVTWGCINQSLMIGKHMPRSICFPIINFFLQLAAINGQEKAC